MTYFLLKTLITAVLIVLIAELAKRSTWLAALVASLPIVSLLAFIWLYLDSHDLKKVSALAQSIFWLVIPSLALFLLLPWGIKQGFGFWTSLGLGLLGTLGCYGAMLIVIRAAGIQL